MKAIAAAALLLGLSLVAAPASADIVTVNDTTVGGPTYNRVLSGTPPTNLSAVGTAVSYDVTAFTVAAAGSYGFLLTGDLGSTDTFLTLYSGAFNPLAPLTNALAANDDVTAVIGAAGFTTALLAGTSYFAVATYFENGVSGAYSLRIEGPGAISIGGDSGAVPEPASWALMLLGFGGLGATLRAARRRTAMAATA